jgi:hypothetical protein
MQAERTLEDRPDSTHLVQCYQADETVLVRNAARFLKEGFERAADVIVIATSGHRTAFIRELKRLGAIAPSGSDQGSLTLLDAADVLARIMVAGAPDAATFDEVVGTMVRNAVRDGSALYAYGDMVGELWKAKRYAAAAKLEHLWNMLRAVVDFDLFCAYPVDMLTEPFEANAVDAILRSHTHLLPSGPDGDLESALHRAFGELAGADDTLVKRVREFHEPAWASMPDAEAMIIWLRHAMPDRAPAILELAERYYRLAS